MIFPLGQKEKPIICGLPSLTEFRTNASGSTSSFVFLSLVTYSRNGCTTTVLQHDCDTEPHEGYLSSGGGLGQHVHSRILISSNRVFWVRSTTRFGHHDHHDMMDTGVWCTVVKAEVKAVSYTRKLIGGSFPMLRLASYGSFK